MEATLIAELEIMQLSYVCDTLGVSEYRELRRVSEKLHGLS
jgi:hypothetical protein